MYVEPRVEYDRDTDARSIVCWVCGDPMHAELGRAVGSERVAWLLWWRCSGNPRHVTHALPLPMEIAGGY